MGHQIKTVAFATLALAGTLAVPAGAMRNAAAAAASMQEVDLSTVDGVRAALAAARATASTSGQVLAIVSAGLQGKTADQVLAIVQAATAQFPTLAAAIVSEASQQNPTLAPQIASAAVAALPAGQAAAAAPAIVRAAAVASGVSTAAVAAVVAGNNDVGGATQLAEQADNTSLAGLVGTDIALGNPQATGATDEGASGFTGEFQPTGMGGADGTGPTSTTGTGEGAASNAAQNNGVDPSGNGPNASPT